MGDCIRSPNKSIKNVTPMAENQRQTLISDQRGTVIGDYGNFSICHVSTSSVRKSLSVQSSRRLGLFGAHRDNSRENINELPVSVKASKGFSSNNDLWTLSDRMPREMNHKEVYIRTAEWGDNRMYRSQVSSPHVERSLHVIPEEHLKEQSSDTQLGRITIPNLVPKPIAHRPNPLVETNCEFKPGKYQFGSAIFQTIMRDDSINIKRAASIRYF